MVTVPGLTGCLKWRWLPFIRSNRQPSLSTMRMASRTFGMVGTSSQGACYHILNNGHACASSGEGNHDDLSAGILDSWVEDGALGGGELGYGDAVGAAADVADTGIVEEAD